MSVKQLLERGLFLQRRGNIEHAFQAYQQILKVEPNNFDAKHYMGVCLFQTQKLDQALQCFYAIKKHPSVSAEYFNNYALALSANQAHVEALSLYETHMPDEFKFGLFGTGYGR